MKWLYRGSIPLLAVLTSTLLAQPPVEDESSEVVAQTDRRSIAVEELVRELRSSRDPDPQGPSDTQIEEWLAGGSKALGWMFDDGCELRETAAREIQELEARIEESRGQDAEPTAELRELKLQLIELRSQAHRHCCEQLGCYFF